MAQFPNGTPYTGSASGIWNLKDMRNALMGGNWPLGVHAPGAPTSPFAYAGDTEAVITFTEPADTGGYSITGYTATSTPDSHTGTASTSPVTVTGLTNGTAYTFDVKATTSIDTGIASSASNSVTPNSSSVFNLLVVGGGAGGGAGGAGTAGGGAGGGAGAVIYNTGVSFTLGYSYSVTIGAGGASHTNGNDSIFESYTAIGGGRGGNYSSSQNGGNGGSGGGGGGATGGSSAGTAGTGVSGQGYSGGTGWYSGSYPAAGGGGGSASIGLNSSEDHGGDGGSGSSIDITGTYLYYGGGGGGSAWQSGGTYYHEGVGGSSIGGTGSSTSVGGAGTANRGAGGGGGSSAGGGGGGSGVVIFKIADTVTTTISGGLSHTDTSIFGYNIYTITAGTGTVTFS